MQPPPSLADRGTLDVDRLRELIDAGHVDTVIAAFPDVFGRLLGKRFVGRFFLDDVVPSGFHLTGSLGLGYDFATARIPDLPMASPERGHGDIRLVPDLSTLRTAAWLERSAIVLCDVFDTATGAPAAIAPRTILRTQISRARGLGLTAMGASEVEFYLFRDSYAEAAAKAYTDLRTTGTARAPYAITQGTVDEAVIAAIRRACDGSGIVVEGSHPEFGPGQHEINLRHAEFLKTADRLVLYKQVTKDVAWSHGHSVTFMAKWDETKIGSSMHVHVSLWDGTGTSPAFPGGEVFEGLEVSAVFRHFLGGLIRHTREVFPFYAPFPTSYKRYWTGATAGMRIAWGRDRRTVGFRVVGDGPSLRIECRVPGADANPYLVYAAILASGIDGVENKIEPPSSSDPGSLTPLTLAEAIRELEASAWSRGALGDQVVDHYLRVFQAEQAQFDQTVTTWERARYFERA